MKQPAAVTLILLAVAVGFPDNTGAREYWVPVAAHSAGLENTTWRTDVAILNLCTVEATVELTLRSDASEYNATFVVPAGGQTVFQDVVAQLTTEETLGSLEINSDQELVINSRTYNLTAQGTYGQYLDGVSDADGLDKGESAYLANLRQSPAYRTNFGLLNMAGSAAKVRVTLHDRTGARVGAHTIAVPAAALVQDLAPFSARYGRTDIVGGFAQITVADGKNIYAYASVADSATGDATTVIMKTWDGTCDFSQALDDFFGLEKVHEIDITVDREGVTSLLAEPRTHVRAAVVIDGTTLPEVGVRLKGGAGSFVPLDGDYPEISGDGNGKPGKSAFIVDLDRYSSATSFLGLDKLTLNNMVQDPSCMHELLGYTLFRAGAIPASRSGYAVVTFNGEDKGLYSVIESADNPLFLDRWYDTSAGNLYEGEYGADLRSEHVEWFDQDNGSDESRTDLAAFAAALDAIGPADDAITVLQQHLDLDEYLAFAATELFLGHWDGYAWSANNYFIHHSPEDGLWTFLPWGIDQLFEDTMGRYAGIMQEPGPAWTGGGRVHALCLSSATCRSLLADAVEELIDRVDQVDLAGLAEQARDLVEPLALAESTVYGDPDLTTDAMDRVESFIAGRGDEMAAWLPCLTGTVIDHDGDTFDACTTDCDDGAASVHPGATESCNLTDDDCNGILDDPAHCPKCLDETGPGGVSFALCFDASTWSAARASCTASGGELASIHDPQTFEALSFALLERLGIHHAWIGLNDRDTEGEFQWTDGSALDFAAWTSDSPKPWGHDMDCVLNAFWGWSDVACEEQHAYICRE